MAQPNKSESKLADATDNPQVGNRIAAITAPTAGGSGATAGAFADATIRDSHTDAINAIIAALEAHGLIADN